MKNIFNKRKSFYKKFRNQQRGQVVLMVLLASALVLTLGLSASRQATIETKIDTDQELLKKAFNVAESGIENYLATGKTQYGEGSFDGSASLDIGVLGNTELLSFENITLPGGVENFILTDLVEEGIGGTDYYSKKDDTISVCDKNNGNGYFQIDYFYKLGMSINKESETKKTVDGCVDFDLSAGDSMLLSVKPINFYPKIEIRGGAKFPIQGEEIKSTGKVDKINNTVTVLNKFSIPTFLLEAVTAEGNVTNK